jgi:putative Mg2+ transporter-C (MgtC) family protein
MALPIDWSIFLTILEKIGFAYLLAMPTGFWREREGHAIGIRTFPIVAIASCGYLLIMQGGAAPGGSAADYQAANSRVLQGLVAGIGFVGGGAILKQGMNVHGTATAASIWNTGAIGAAVAMGRYEIGIVLSLLNLFTMGALVPLKKRLDRMTGASEVHTRKRRQSQPPL